MTNRGRRAKNNITTEECVNPFENLLNHETENRNADMTIDIDVNEPIDEIEDFIFNTEISEDEKRLATKNFRKKKKPKPNCILPEFCLYGIDYIAHILVKLFNRLFKKNMNIQKFGVSP